MDHEDSLLLKLTLENWHLLKKSFITEEMFVSSLFMLQFWCSKFSTLKFLRLVINSDVPLSPLLHFEKLLDHLLDRLHLLLRLLLVSVEELSHGSTIVSDGIWDTIKLAEFWWYIDLSTSLVHGQHWLSLV